MPMAQPIPCLWDPNEHACVEDLVSLVMEPSRRAGPKKELTVVAMPSIDMAESAAKACIMADGPCSVAPAPKDAARSTATSAEALPAAVSTAARGLPCRYQGFSFMVDAR